MLHWTTGNNYKGLVIRLTLTIALIFTDKYLFIQFSTTLGGDKHPVKLIHNQERNGMCSHDRRRL